MKIMIQSKNIHLSPDMRRSMTKQIRHILGRYGFLVSRATVHLDDTNGPKEGNDISCTVNVDLRRRKDDVHVHSLGTDWQEAFDVALERASHHVQRKISADLKGHIKSILLWQ